MVKKPVKKTLIILLGVIILVGLAFYAGVRLGPYLDKASNLRRNIEKSRYTSTKNSDNTPERLAPENQEPSSTNQNVVLSGKILSISALELEVEDLNKASVKVALNDETIVTLNGKGVNLGELKLGKNVSMFVRSDDAGNKTAIRIKIIQ